MKHLTKWSRSLAVALASMTSSVVAFAQSQAPTVDVTTTTTTSEIWYTQWWVWAAGIAVFLIVVIALTNRGGRNSA